VKHEAKDSISDKLHNLRYKSGGTIVQNSNSPTRFIWALQSKKLY